MIHLITYADGKVFQQTQQMLKNSYIKADIDTITEWNREKIVNTPFYLKNKSLLNIKKGSGLWIWKPYIIYEKLKTIPEGDWIMYQDCSRYYKSEYKYSIKPVIEYLEKNDIICIPGFALKTTNNSLIKEECYNYFYPDKNIPSDLRQKYHQNASIIYVKNIPKSNRFIKK